MAGLPVWTARRWRTSRRMGRSGGLGHWRICRRIGGLTIARNGLLDPDVIVDRLNRLMTGWAHDFVPGRVSPAYAAIDRHANRRLRQWLYRKHKVRAGKQVRFPDECLYDDMGLPRLAPRTSGFPWAKA